MPMTDRPSATTHFSEALCAGFTRTFGLAQQLVMGIPADRFARCPEGCPTMNHPAFIVGHLSIYPDRVCTIIGREDLASPREGYEGLFSPQARNQDDPSGTIYPSMDEIVGYFTERHESLMNVLPGVTDETMQGEMPIERFREVFPTVGAGVSFLVGPHLMMHLGQLSAWRRAEGLGPAMPHVGT
ncbi:MAG: DinB family protein [Phycisphaerales bacterium]